MLVDTAKLRFVLRQQAQAQTMLSGRVWENDILHPKPIGPDPKAVADEEALKRVETLWKSLGSRPVLPG